MRSPDFIARIRSLIDAGRWSDAEAAWLAEAGAAPLAWRDLGFLYAEHGKHAKAEEALERARSLGEARGATESMLAAVKQELGDDAGALGCYQRGARLDPGDLRIALGSALYLPQVYESIEDVARWRSRYERGLDALLAHEEAFRPAAQQVFELDRGNFLLAYQGEDDLPLQRKFSSFIGALIDSAAPEWRAPMPKSFDGARRLRVGFLASTFRDCTAGRYFERWITGLDAGRFERFVYHTAASSDAITQRIAASV